MTETEWLELFADELEYNMRQQGLTRLDLERMSGVSRENISKYINKRQMPSIKSAINLLCALDLEYNELLGDLEPIE